MRYPFGEIQKLHNEIKDESIIILANRLRNTFPTLIKDSDYKTSRIKDTPAKIPVSDIWINDDILQITVTNLAVLDMTHGRLPCISRYALKWATNKADVDFIQHLTRWAKYADDDSSIVNLAHLAYYEAAVRKCRPLEAGNVILPGGKECKLIRQLADTLIRAIGSNPLNLIYRLDHHVQYNSVVTRGDIDFLTNDCLYITQLQGAEESDRYYLLICYALVKHTPKYKDMNINRICMVNPAHGTLHTLEISKIDPMALTIVTDCMYGPTPQGDIETALPRKRRAALATGLVMLFEAKTRESVIQQVTRISSAYLPTQTDETDDPHVKESFLAVVVYFSTPHPTKKDDGYYVEGINLLNQFLVDIENIGQPDKKTVRLSSEVSQDILRKALDF